MCNWRVTAAGKWLRSALWLLLSIYLPQTAVGALPAPPKEVARQTPIRIETDVEYGRVNGVSLRLDLYLPGTEGTELRPGLVFIHGGGWVGGNKREFAARAREMAERGYVAASVNYRLAPKYRYPAALEDVQRAVRWLRAHAPEFRLDPGRIGAMGASAGGYLAAMLGVLDRPDPSGEPSARVQCVVCFYGRMDLTLEQSAPGFTDYRPAYLGKTKEEALALYMQASPINHLDAGDPPFLLVHGTRDRQVSVTQSQRMLAALDRVGVEASLLLINRVGHGFRGPAAQEAWEAARVFLDRHLLRPPARAGAR